MNVDPQLLIAIGAALIISLTMHEFGHARTALAFGDPTAKMHGRVSLNPLRHLDPVGSIVFVLSSMAGVGLGWAKPVPVNSANLHPPRLGDIMVSLAGPMANLALAIFAGLLIRLWLMYPDTLAGTPLYGFLWKFLVLMLTCNLSLLLFNLLPLYPLDGHHIQREILPANLRAPFMQWQMSFGRYILLGLIFLPRVVEIVLKHPVIHPISWLFTKIMDPMITFLTGQQLLS